MTRKDMQGTIVRGHLRPAGLSSVHHEALADTLERHVRHAGYLSGPLNFDVRLTGEGIPIVLELAPRLGGNWIPQLIAYSSGADLFEAVVRNALRESVSLEVLKLRPAASFVIGSGEDRLLEEDIPVDDVKNAIGPLIELELDFRAGDRVEPFRDSAQQVGRALFDLESARYEEVTAELERTLTPWLAPTRPPARPEAER